MAVTKGKLTMADGQEFELTLTAGDRLRATKEQPPDTDEETLTYFAVYLCAKRNQLPHTAAEFLEWADQVADFDPAITEKQIAELLAMGQIDEGQAEKMRALIEPAPGGEGEGSGEASATPSSSPASLCAPASPSEIS